LERLHDLVIVWLVIIITAVIIIRVKILVKPYIGFLNLNSLTLEVTWTLIPIGILVSIAAPRIFLLCSQDSLCSIPNHSVKLIRNQWNWQSEQQEGEQQDHVNDLSKLDELSCYENPLILPFHKMNRILLTRRDVLHSLGVPSLGIKLDSIPGRLNVVVFESSVPGLLTGSCYELCGRGHRAIPIFLLSV
jgi:heme/copper-type cytochrome/quinol oxidase subunit 2